MPLLLYHSSLRRVPPAWLAATLSSSTVYAVCTFNSRGSRTVQVLPLACATVNLIRLFGARVFVCVLDWHIILHQPVCLCVCLQSGLRILGCGPRQFVDGFLSSVDPPRPGICSVKCRTLSPPPRSSPVRTISDVAPATSCSLSCAVRANGRAFPWLAVGKLGREERARSGVLCCYLLRYYAALSQLWPIAHLCTVAAWRPPVSCGLGYVSVSLSASAAKERGGAQEQQRSSTVLLCGLDSRDLTPHHWAWPPTMLQQLMQCQQSTAPPSKCSPLCPDASGSLSPPLIASCLLGQCIFSEPHLCSSHSPSGHNLTLEQLPVV